MTGLEEGGVAFKRSQMVSVSSQTNVSVGADCEKCASFHPQLGRRDGVELPDGGGDLRAGRDGHSGFKQGRMFYVFLQGSVQSR